MRRTVLVLALLSGCTSNEAPGSPPLFSDTSDFQRMGTPRKGDWLTSFDEPGQTFEEYVSGTVNRKDAERSIICIRPLGAVLDRHGETIEKMRAFAEIYFGCETRLLDPHPLPTEAYDRERRQYDATKIHTRLQKTVPKGAIAYIGLTDADLFSKGLNFVFGEGSLQQRVGIYSLKRLAHSDASQFLRRSLKLMCHEVGHIFSINHCIEFQCRMNGSNSLGESDRQPLNLCPVDLRKLQWNVGFNPRNRYDRMRAYFVENALLEEATFIQTVKGKLRSSPESS